MIELTFFLDPVAKQRPRFTSHRGKPRAYTAPKTELFENAIKALAYPMMRDQKPIEGPAVVWIDFYFKKPKSSKNKHHVVKPDNDNLQKSVFDALNGICWNDDSQIVEIHSRKLYGEKSKIHLRAYSHDEIVSVSHISERHLRRCAPRTRAD